MPRDDRWDDELDRLLGRAVPGVGYYNLELFNTWGVFIPLRVPPNMVCEMALALLAGTLGVSRAYGHRQYFSMLEETIRPQFRE